MREDQVPGFRGVNCLRSGADQLRRLMSSEFPIVPTTIDASSESCTKNRKDWETVLERHEEALRWCISEGQDKYVKRHIERGMLLCTPPLCVYITDPPARDRINLLLDPDTPFLELCIFAGYKQSGSSPSASVIAGIGVVKYSLVLPLPPPIEERTRLTDFYQRHKMHDNVLNPNHRRRLLQRLLSPQRLPLINHSPRKQSPQHLPLTNSRGLPPPTIPCFPLRGSLLPESCHSFRTRLADMYSCLWIVYCRRGIFPWNERLYHFRREAGTGFSWGTAVGENGDGGDKYCGGIRWCGDAF